MTRSEPPLTMQSHFNEMEISMRLFYRSRVLAALWLVVVFASPVAADVKPPLEAQLLVLEQREDRTIDVEVTTMVPEFQENPEASIRLALESEGILQPAGPTEWTVEEPVPGHTYRFQTVVRATELGYGLLRLQAESFDSRGERLWGRADAVYMLLAPDDPVDLLLNKSSYFELKRQKLTLERRRGELDERGYEVELQKLMEGQELRFERNIREEREQRRRSKDRSSKATAGSVASATISGRITYTPRIGRNGTPAADVFAAAADSLPVRRARVAFFDQRPGGPVELATVPAVVTTDDAGNYTAVVPGKRSDDTAVDLVVRLVAENPACRIGPRDQRVLLHSTSSDPFPVTSASHTEDIQIDDSDLPGLRVAALLDGMLTAFDFVTTNNVSTGVGVDPARIFIEFPGDNATGSFFHTAPDDHLNIGLRHAFDWDVYTHEYGHYVQKLNGTTQNPGGCHYINGNNTGFNQVTCGGPNRVLTKHQAIRLAWAEGWPTFFGTNLQIASGAGSFGIYGVGDLVYTDTANNFRYDIEQNAEPPHMLPRGEDNELTVQRVLWDFADQNQDDHDELTYGTEAMWRHLAGDSAVVTLDAFRAKFAGLVPSSPAGYDTGTVEQNRVKQGRIYFDLNIGPAPLAPADNAPVDVAAPPQFLWNTRGSARDAATLPPGYRFDRFRVLFFDEDYGTKIFESPEITTTGSPDQTSWTPTAAEWSTIVGSDAASRVVKWVVEGRHDGAPSTGFYRGLERTLGSVDVSFVVDDTGSMTEEIAGVRQALTQAIDSLRTLAESPLVQVITFKDDVTHRLISRDLDEIQSVVDSLSATGGGDCPESSVEALLAAVKNLPSGAALQFATDASSHRGMDLDGIKAEIRNRGIELTEIISGDCAPPGEMAAAFSAVTPADSDNHDPDHIEIPRLPPVPDVYHDVLCDECPPDDSVGPAMSPNALAVVGDPGLEDPSSVAVFQSIAAASPAGKFLFMPDVKTGDAEPYINVIANAVLSGVVPTVVAVVPTDLPQGATMDVAVLAGQTNFLSTSTVSFDGGGVVVNEQQVISPSELLLNVSVAHDAEVGFRNVSVSTPLGSGTMEIAGGSGQARVVSDAGSPALASVQPARLTRGSTSELTIWGVNAAFSSAASVDLDDLIVESVTVDSPIRLRAAVTVPEGAFLGFRTLRVTSGSLSLSIDNSVSVVEATSAEPLPILADVNPISGAQGSNVFLTITGSNTHFLEGVTVASFSGAGIAVHSVDVLSSTSAVVGVSIAPEASLGFRDVVMTTGGESASLPNGFRVIAGAEVLTIPTLSEIGMVLLALLLTAAGLYVLRGR